MNILLSVILSVIITGLLTWGITRFYSLKTLKAIVELLPKLLPEDEIEIRPQELHPQPIAVKTGVGKARVEVGERKDVTIEVPLATAEVEGLPPSVVITGSTKEEAQERLDEDTKRNGSVRGVIRQRDDGKWSINWTITSKTILGIKTTAAAVHGASWSAKSYGIIAILLALFFGLMGLISYGIYELLALPTGLKIALPVIVFCMLLIVGWWQKYRILMFTRWLDRKSVAKKTIK